MNGLLSLLSSIFLLCSVHMLAQPSAEADYNAAVAAYQHGDSPGAVKILETVVHSNALQGEALGRAWLLLGSSYKAQAEYEPARRAYDNAMRLLRDDAKDYAVALRESGALYRETGDSDQAESLLRKSLTVSERNQDHAGIARTSEALSELALTGEHLKQAETYIARAEDESQLTNEFDGDDRAYMKQLDGLIALKRKDPQRAIHDYQESVDLLVTLHGEGSPLTGWGYILLATAYDRGGTQTNALEDMQKGMAILQRTLGSHDPRYAEAEIRYADVLDETGDHSLAARLRQEGRSTLAAVRQAQCAGCAITAASR